jgi:hypothetical protein
LAAREANVQSRVHRWKKFMMSGMAVWRGVDSHVGPQRIPRRLRRSDPSSGTVTDVAVDLGVRHFGRFSGQYGQLFGEYPSETLRAQL